MWATQVMVFAKPDRKNWGQKGLHSYLHGQLWYSQRCAAKRMAPQHKSLARRRISLQSMYHRANQCTLNAILEMAMVFAVEIQLTMHMGMHQARARRSPHLKHLLIEV